MANLTVGTNVVKDGNGTAVSGGVQTYTDPNRSNAQGPVAAIVLADGTILALGQATKAASLPFAFASDQGANPLDVAATTGSITAADAASTTVTNSVSQSVTTGTPTAASSVSATLSGQSAVWVQISGTYSATLAFERSVDGGTTWLPHALDEVTQGVVATSLAVSDNKPVILRGSAAGVTTVRVRCTAYTSGTVTVRIQPGYGVGNVPVVAAGGAWPSNVSQVGGTAIDTGSGNKSAGTPRVVLATDQPNLTTPLNVSKAAQNQTLADGTPLAWKASGGDYAITMTSVTNNNGRQGAKGDLGATRAQRYAVQVTNSVGSAATAGLEVEYYWAASPSATAGTSNPGGTSGADATFNTTPDEYKNQLQFIGSLVLSNNAGTGVQTMNLGPFTPRFRYGFPVMVNKSGQTLGATAGDHTFTLTPMQDAG